LSCGNACAPCGNSMGGIVAEARIQVGTVLAAICLHFANGLLPAVRVKGAPPESAIPLRVQRPKISPWLSAEVEWKRIGSAGDKTLSGVESGTRIVAAQVQRVERCDSFRWDSRAEMSDFSSMDWNRCKTPDSAIRWNSCA